MNIGRIMTIAKALFLFKITAKARPLFVSWQLTNRCNLRCKYCDYWMGKKEEELSTDEVFKIIDDLANLGTLAISFTGGEPLLRDDLGTVITYAKKKGIASKINTNGLLIPEKLVEIQDVYQVNLSFDGPQEVHDEVRGKGSYKATFQAIEILRENNKRVVFHATLTRYNLDSLDYILDKCRRLGIGVFFQPATELYLLNKDLNPFSPEADKYKRAMLLLIEMKKHNNKYIYNSLSGLGHLYHWPSPKGIYCCAGKIAFRINAEGQLYHCERFPNSNKISCRERGLEYAFKKLRPLSCNGCWCGPLVELNLAMGNNLDAILNTLRL